jgi:histidyl-tRNA synthetase
MSKLQAPRGTHDLSGEEILKFEWVCQKFADVAKSYGFSQISTPIFESLQVFDRTLGEQSDIVSKEMYVFSDRGGDKLSLRPEGTAGVVRAFLSNSWQRDLPLKLFYMGPMFRYERPQKGRYRQFHQIGVEALGLESPLVDAEIIASGHALIEALGIAHKSRLEINSLGSKESRQKYREALVSYLKQFVSSLSEDSQRRLETNPLRILDSKDTKDLEICAKAPRLEDFLDEKSQKHFSETQRHLKTLGINYSINPRLVRGLDYYNDVVFEFKTSELGAQDAVLSGGRYDGLVETMGGPATPGFGYAAGIERLMLLLDSWPKPDRPVVMAPLGEAAEVELIKLGQELRQKGISVEFTYSGNLGKRLKRASKLNAKAAIILGDEELQSSPLTYNFKDFDSGEQKPLSKNDIFNSLIKG